MDMTILNFIQNHLRSTVGDHLFPVITALGNAGLVWLALAAVPSENEKAGAGRDGGACPGGDSLQSHSETAGRKGTSVHGQSGCRAADYEADRFLVPVWAYQCFLCCCLCFVFQERETVDTGRDSGSSDCLLQAVSVCTLSDRCAGRGAGRDIGRVDRCERDGSYTSQKAC